MKHMAIGKKGSSATMLQEEEQALVYRLNVLMEKENMNAQCIIIKMGIPLNCQMEESLDVTRWFSVQNADNI